MNQLNFAAIGTGGIFKTVQFMIQRNKRAKLACIVDINEESAKKWSEKLGTPYCCSTDEFYEDYCKDIDAVYIATPHFTHTSMMDDAIDNNINIFIEKPLTTKLDDAIRIVNKAEKEGVKIGVDFQNRYNPQAVNMARAVQDGHLGKIMYGTVNVPWKRTKNYYESSPWRGKLETAGGGTLMTHAIHFIDILIWALGTPVSVSGKIATRRHDIEVEDVGMGLIEFESGAIAQVLSSAANDPGAGTHISIFGEKGNILFRGSIFSQVKWQRVKRKKYPLDAKGLLSYGKIVDAFISYVMRNKPFNATGKESLKITAVIDAIYESSRTGKEVSIDTSIFQ
ncbi:MAG: Gfo/Idh/MocA family oxidoreductase [Candidatus Lokiarchaeota archaeon]|nr:Gfo/Idh/MocA family oxidoreductase [Candidatus Lokiarchaeota archaeon]